MPLFGNMMDYPLTLTHILRRMQRNFSHRLLVWKNEAGAVEQCTYGECFLRINRAANALKRLGVREGDRVGVLSWNNRDYFELYYAIPCMGAVIHTINVRYSEEQLIYTINHAQDEILFVDPSLLPVLEKILKELKHVREVIVMDASWEARLQNESEEFSWPTLDERQAAGLCYSSGTTGSPNGVLYSHRSQFLLAMAVAFVDTLGLSKADTILPIVPMFHANAWGLPYAAPWVGAQLVFAGSSSRPEDLIHLIQSYNVTLGAAVPTVWMGIYDQLKVADIRLPSLRAIVAGGSAMPSHLIHSFENEFGTQVIHAWGMTELSSWGSSTGYSGRKETQGYMTPQVEMKIEHPETQDELPWDGQSIGELLVRGPTVAASYYLPFGVCALKSEGWLKTGDMATLTPDGCVTLVDRTKDLIKSGGEWISSVALENALMAHPGVSEAAVVAMPDEKWGERPAAFVVSSPNHRPSDLELKEFLLNSKFHSQGNIPKYWLPDRFEWLSSIPKTSVGKFNKKLLRNQFFPKGDSV